MVDEWLKMFGKTLDTPVPDAYRIWQQAQKYLSEGNQENANRCERLTYVLHNSHIPNALRMGPDVKFGYGGIGVVIHPSCEIGRGATIGANVTLGGRSGAKRRVTPDGQLKFAPLIEDYAYVATGAKILGGITVGAMSIIGANAVVIEDIPPLSVAAGVPAKVIGKITPENALSKKSTYLSARDMTGEDFVAMVRYYGRDKSLDRLADWGRPVGSHSYNLRRNIIQCPDEPGWPKSFDLNKNFTWKSIDACPAALQKWLHSLIALRALLNHSSRAFHDIITSVNILRAWREENSPTNSAAALAWDYETAAIRAEQVAAIWAFGFQDKWMETVISEHIEIVEAAAAPDMRLKRATALAALGKATGDESMIAEAQQVLSEWGENDTPDYQRLTALVA
ncbi:hypothetical protein JFX10_05220 (plasmid) [Sinorhizobium meliloti]|nr:hypothetical protein [Sinorhizobium meliloti]QQF01600.1 hypothetical protein JFX10_05220 [Sinorhizobium meliloti]